MKALDQLILETPTGPLRDKLTEINLAIMNALLPSEETKKAYIGQFSFNFPAHNDEGAEVTYTPNVPWVTIKKIMAKIEERMESCIGE